MPDLDLHMLYDCARPEWRETAIASIEAQGFQPRLVASVPGDINTARLIAFDTAKAEWLSWVDSDDIVLPGALDALTSALTSSVDGACTDEDVIRADGSFLCHGLAHGKDLTVDTVLSSPRAAHHLMAVHRSVVDRMRPHIKRYPRGIEWMLAFGAATGRGLKRVPFTGYQWRQHPDNWSRRHTPDFHLGLRRYLQAL